MGCASSKQQRCRHCKSPYSPLPRSYSVPSHHPPEKAGESHHFVALTSTTLGSLKLDSLDQNDRTGADNNSLNSDNNNGKNEGFSMEVYQAKTWSDMINQKLPKITPKTPIRTPPGEPETINTWELMEGLEDNSPLRLPIFVDRAFSFHAVPNLKQQPEEIDQTKSKLQENGLGSPKPLWLQMKETDVSDHNSNPIVSNFDPEIISTFRRALEELSPVSKVQPLSPKIDKISSPDDNGCIKVSKHFADVKKVNDFMSPTKCPPFGEDRVVIYFTSLRGVRKTYEDCCHVRVILKGFGVRVDERDVSMHYGFREELKEILGFGFRGGLPRVFVKGRYIGGAEEVKQMNEDGELEKVLQGCAVVDDGAEVCELCGDVRFVPCERCSGSCKIYIEEGDEWEGDEEGREFRRCPDCNENGIIRCPVCCY